MKLTDIIISSNRNAWGWFTASTIYKGQLLTMRYDTRPSKHQAKQDLLNRYNH